MPATKPRIFLRLEYEEAAQAYLHSLPPEHFMESTAQATQRKITLESLDLVHAHRPEVQVFNELLVQYSLSRTAKPRQVVPDNMIVVHSEPIKAEGSFDILFQPVKPFCVLEYVSNSNKRKDYEENMVKYERELKVPYYLLFYPDAQELTLYRLADHRYVSVKPNKAGRLTIRKLKLEVALLDSWVRYWYQGELLPLPADLLRDRDAARRDRDATQRELQQTRGELEQERQARQGVEAELTRLRAQLAQARPPNGKS